MEQANLGNIMELKNRAISELKTIYKELYGLDCPSLLKGDSVLDI